MFHDMTCSNESCSRTAAVPVFVCIIHNREKHDNKYILRMFVRLEFASLKARSPRGELQIPGEVTEGERVCIGPIYLLKSPMSVLRSLHLALKKLSKQNQILL